MEPSSLIFVALAVAWGVYLVPKALKHHDDAVRGRSVEKFSHTMRVLARREPVNTRNARLVVTPGRTPSASTVTVKPAAAPTPAQLRSSRRAAAALRRRRVLGILVLATVVVGALAGFGVVHSGFIAIPVTLLVAWLVACRLTVRAERAVHAPIATPMPVEGPAESDETGSIDLHDTATTMPAVATSPVVESTVRADGLWDPMPMTLPTYVTAPAATRRTVRTIDLDSTGVWSSGRSEIDSALAREADAADQAGRVASREGEQRATGS